MTFWRRTTLWQRIHKSLVHDHPALCACRWVHPLARVPKR